MRGLKQLLEYYGYKDPHQQEAVIKLLETAGCFKLERLIPEFQKLGLQKFPYGTLTIEGNSLASLLNGDDVDDVQFEKLQSWFKKMVTKEIQSCRKWKDKYDAEILEFVVPHFFALLDKSYNKVEENALNLSIDLSNSKLDLLEAIKDKEIQKNFTHLYAFYVKKQYTLTVSRDQLLTHGLKEIAELFHVHFGHYKLNIVCDAGNGQFSANDMYMVISRDILKQPATLAQTKEEKVKNEDENTQSNQNTAIIKSTSSSYAKPFLTLAAITTTFFAVRSSNTVQPIIGNIMSKLFDSHQ